MTRSPGGRGRRPFPLESAASRRLGCAALSGAGRRAAPGGGGSTCQPSRRRPPCGAHGHGRRDGRLRDGGGRTGRREGKRGEPRRLRAAERRAGWVGREWPGLVAKRVKSQSGGPAEWEARGPPRGRHSGDAAPFAFGSDAAGSAQAGGSVRGTRAEMSGSQPRGCTTSEKLSSSRPLLPSGFPGYQAWNTRASPPRALARAAGERGAHGGDPPPPPLPPPWCPRENLESVGQVGVGSVRMDGLGCLLWFCFKRARAWTIGFLKITFPFLLSLITSHELSKMSNGDFILVKPCDGDL